MKYEINEDITQTFWTEEEHTLKRVSFYGPDDSALYGGWIEKPENLLNDADFNCKVDEEAKVFGNAIVRGEALVCENSTVYGNAICEGNCIIKGHSSVKEDAFITGHAVLMDFAECESYCAICDNATISDHAKISGSVQIRDHAKIYGFADISGFAIIEGNACIHDNAEIEGGVRIGGYANIGANASISSNNHYLVVGPVTLYGGSIYDYMTFYRTFDERIFVCSHQFNGDSRLLIQSLILSGYSADSKIVQICKAALIMAQAKIGININDTKPAETDYTSIEEIHASIDECLKDINDLQESIVDE